MIAKFVASALAALSLAGCSNLPAGSARPTTDEALVARFRPCVGPTGTPRRLPPLPAEAEAAFTGPVLLLSTAGMVADGYDHSLRLDAERGRGIIVQTGGYANQRSVFGPFDLAAGCRG